MSVTTPSSHNFSNFQISFLGDRDQHPSSNKSKPLIPLSFCCSDSPFSLTQGSSYYFIAISPCHLHRIWWISAIVGYVPCPKVPTCPYCLDTPIPSLHRHGSSSCFWFVNSRLGMALRIVLIMLLLAGKVLGQKLPKFLIPSSSEFLNKFFTASLDRMQFHLDS